MTNPTIVLAFADAEFLALRERALRLLHEHQIKDGSAVRDHWSATDDRSESLTCVLDALDPETDPGS